MVEDFGPGTDSEDPAIAKLSARFLHLSMAAARAAYAMPGWIDWKGRSTRHRVAVVMGSAFGGLDLLDAEQERMSQAAQPGGEPVSGSGE